MKSEQIFQFYEWIQALAQKEGLLFDLHGSSQAVTFIIFQKKRI